VATRYLGTTDTTASLVNSNIVGASSGGTLAGSQKVQLVFDDTVFTSAMEGKQRLINAVTVILDRLKSAKTWPIDSTS